MAGHLFIEIGPLVVEHVGRINPADVQADITFSCCW